MGMNGLVQGPILNHNYTSHINPVKPLIRCTKSTDTQVCPYNCN